MSCKVWAGINELAFHENAILLEALARSQSKQSYNKSATDDGMLPSFPWARDFLDDFALVAAGPGEASNVAAACLEVNRDDGIITIRIAKNENFNPTHGKRLSDVVRIMNQIRTQSIPVSEGQANCFNLIVQGCLPRIMKQIKATKGLENLICEPGTGSLDSSSKLLYQHRAQHSETKEDIEKIGDYTLHTHAEYMQLAATRWTDIMRTITQVKSTSDVESVKYLARLAYDVRHSSSFRLLLEALFRHRASKIIERIGKIAKFFRSAVTIAQVAAQSWSGSEQFKLETVPSISRKVDTLRGRTVAKVKQRVPALSHKITPNNGEVQRLLGRWPKYIVHAEMVLLIFYEEHPKIIRATNYIGISKRSCYLCAKFIQLHSSFAVEGQHQQLYCLWTLPEEIKFVMPGQSAQFFKALAELDRHLKDRVDAISSPSFRPFPFFGESVANFSRVTLLGAALSLEHLDQVEEAEELTVPGLLLTNSVKEGECKRIQTEARSKPETQQHPDTSHSTREQEWLKDSTQRGHSIKPNASQITNAAQLSPVFEDVVLNTDHEKGVSEIEKPPLENVERQHSKSTNQHLHRHRRYRRRRKGIHSAGQADGEGTIGRAGINLPPYYLAHGRKSKYAFSSHDGERAYRSHDRVPRHSKRRSRRSHKARRKEGVGCLSFLAPCIGFLSRLVLILFRKQ